MIDIGRFLVDYDDETNDVTGSSRVTYDANLKEWIAHIREDHFAHAVVLDICKSINSIEWIDNAAKAGSFGQEPIKWPLDKKARLAVQYSIFETLADDKEDFVSLYQSFFGSASEISEMVREFNDQLFTPMARDLRKLLVRRAEQEDADEFFAPASDRFVALDHNNPQQQEAIEALDAVEKTVREANDYEDQEDRETRLAEISAGRRLLDAPRVSLNAIAATLGRALRWLMEKFAGAAIGIAAKEAWENLGPLLGRLWDTLL